MQLTALILLSASSLFTLTNKATRHQDYILTTHTIQNFLTLFSFPLWHLASPWCRRAVHPSFQGFDSHLKTVECCPIKTKLIAFFISESLSGSKPKQYSRRQNKYKQDINSSGQLHFSLLLNSPDKQLEISTCLFFG